MMGEFLAGVVTMAVVMAHPFVMLSLVVFMLLIAFVFWISAWYEKHGRWCWIVLAWAMPVGWCAVIYYEAQALGLHWLG